MNYLKTNWKTTAAGISMMITIAAKWYFERTFNVDIKGGEKVYH